MTEERKDIELAVRGTRIVIPNAVFTILLIGVTAALFMLLEDPGTAGYASAGFAALMLIAKAADVNMDHVLMVLGKTRDDLPGEADPAGFPAQAAAGMPMNKDEEPQLVHVRSDGKVRAWLLG